MLYLLDASALISANNTWFALGRVPEFWLWLRHHGAAGAIAMPSQTYDEVEAGSDNLSKWMSDAATKASILLKESTNAANVQAVLSHYGANLSDADLITIGQDPFLIAAAVGYPDRCVVSSEVSKPGRTGPRRHVPDVCTDCGVKCINPVQLINALDFTTSWNA